MLENTPLVNDCSVLVLSLAVSSPGRTVEATLNYRWVSQTGDVVEARHTVPVRIPGGAKDPETWVKQALGEVLLGLK